jgi:hypothetical protein
MKQIIIIILFVLGTNIYAQQTVVRTVQQDREQLMKIDSSWSFKGNVIIQTMDFSHVATQAMHEINTYGMDDTANEILKTWRVKSSMMKTFRDLEVTHYKAIILVNGKRHYSKAIKI